MTESKRSEDLLLKIQYIKEKQNGLDRGIVFATGTPISNSLTEMYVMKNISSLIISEKKVYSISIHGLPILQK